MPETQGGSSKAGEKDNCIQLSLQSVASFMRASDGRDIPFAKAVLTVRNVCDSMITRIGLHATLGQEGGTFQDVTGSLTKSADSSMPPGGSVSWDVFDVLLPAHPGAASKVHMFGYRAVLNWRFDLEAWAEYLTSGSSIAARTPVSRWAMRWTVANPATGEVELSIEELER